VQETINAGVVSAGGVFGLWHAVRLERARECRSTCWAGYSRNSTSTMAAGLERASELGTRRLRALVVFVDGFMPFGQFTIEQKLRNAGVQLQIEF
jgi:hypothetical protein